MNSILKEAEKLNQIIKESFEYKEYKKCLELKNNSLELKELNEKLNEEKEKNCLKKGKENNSVEEFYKIKKEIDSHPIMVNYLSSYEKLNEYLKEIIQIINKDL